jgi:inner membrane protein
MPTAFAHGLVGASLAIAVPTAGSRWRLAAGLATAAILPDLDIVGFWLGVPYEHVLGHRGFSHSLPFAALLGVLAPIVLHRDVRGLARLRYTLLYALATASHGLLDAFTAGGLGVGLWIPFSDERYFAPFRPLMTSSLNPAHAFGERGLRVLLNEILWIGLPLAVILTARELTRRTTRLQR